MKTIKFILASSAIYSFILALLFMIASCSQNESLPETQTPLVGTVWKLEGFGSPDTGASLIALDATKNNYELLLQSNGKASGKSSVNHLAGKYTLNEKMKALGLDLQVLTFALDTPDGQLYTKRLSEIIRYELQGNILRLYYPEGGYLQYRPSEDDSYLRELFSNLPQ